MFLVISAKSESAMQTQTVQSQQLQHSIVSNRHEEILEITEEMDQLHQLFQQLQNAATEQTPLIQHIEAYAESVVSNLRSANEQLTETIRKKETTNRWKYYSLVMFFIMIIVLVLVVKYV